MIYIKINLFTIQHNKICKYIHERKHFFFINVLVVFIFICFVCFLIFIRQKEVRGLLIVLLIDFNILNKIWNKMKNKINYIIHQKCFVFYQSIYGDYGQLKSRLWMLNIFHTIFGNSQLCACYVHKSSSVLVWI